MLTDQIIQTLLTAEAKALATNGRHGLNVVPVSVIQVQNGSIFLYDFFMRKTVDNILDNSAVALAIWRGFSGVQIKGNAEYITTGDIYDSVVATFKKEFPDRVLTGVIKITPTAIFDVSTDISRAGTQIL